MMCSGCDPTQTSSVLRGQQDGSRAPVPCPSAFSVYNQFMGGVDLGDQLRGYYHVRMKCRKFYQYVAKFLLDVAITNAYILYGLNHPGSKVTTLKFRDVLAKEIIGDYCTRRRAGRNTNLIKPLPLQHHPMKVQTPSGGWKRGRCSLCTERRKRRDTQWFCHDCGVWLCHPGTENDCSFRWHKRRLLQSTPHLRPGRVTTATASSASTVPPSASATVPYGMPNVS